jgi:hypothetical protein
MFPPMTRLKLESVQIRMTTIEKEELQKLAELVNMSLSGYIRYLIARESGKL